MTDPVLPPGWYEGEAGGRRFWDGQRWLTAAPAPVPSTRGARLSSRAVLAIVLAGVVLVVATLAATAVVRERHRVAVDALASQAAAVSASVSASLEASASAEASSKAEILRGIEQRASAAASSKAAQQAADDLAMDEQVQQLTGKPWTVIQSGHLYAQWADDKDVTCGIYPCAGLYVLSVDGCPNSLYVEATLRRGDVTLGYSNDLVGAVEPHGIGVATLEDVDRTGGDFVLSQVNCR